MESQDRKPRKRREREEIGGQMLANNLIGEIDRLERIGAQAERTAKIYEEMFENIKSTVLKVDTAALDAKTKEFADALEKQVGRIRAATRTVRTALWLLIVMLFLVFAVGYCYLEAQPWKEKYQQLEQQYIQLQTEMQAQQAAKPVKKRK